MSGLRRRGQRMLRGQAGRPVPLRQVAAPPTLSDPEAQRRFAEDGYAVVDLLDADASGALLDVCRSLHPTATTTWECDFYDPDRARKEAAGAAIEAAFAGPIAHHLDDHRTFLHNFVMNWPGPDGGLELHQHSSTVDERSWRSAVVWCALNDCDESNGTLHVVPRSHRVQVGPKAERGPAWFTDHTERLLARHLDTVSLRAGQALVLDNALLHCSFANTAGAPRLTAVATVAPRAATLHYYDWVGDGVVRAHELDPAFFLDSVMTGREWSEPDGLPVIGLQDVPPTVVTPAQLEAWLPRGSCHVVHRAAN